MTDLKQSRWYDSYPKFAKNLEKLKDLEEDKRTYVMVNITRIIKDKNPQLLEPEHALDFPLDPKKRRWYDQDPYLWLLVNTLKASEKEIIDSVADYFTLELSVL